MKYMRFEMLAVAVGGVAIFGTIVASWRGQPIVEELIAQLLLLAVLVGAVHWGRNGGFVAAVFAIVVYIAMRAPLVAGDGITPDVLDLVLVRTVTYGFVGIVGGEVCGRIKYLLARLESALNVDEETQLYDQRFVARLVESNFGQYSRYTTPFSIGLIELTPALTSELAPARRRSLLKATANHIRNDVRLVDDVGRLDDGRFVLVLPHTPKQGGQVAAERVRTGLLDLLGARDESVTSEVIGAPEDVAAIQGLARSLVPDTASTDGAKAPATAAEPQAH